MRRWFQFQVCCDVSAKVQNLKAIHNKLNDDNQELVDIIRDLLKPSKDGILKANRVLELSSRASKIGDPELIEQVEKLQEAYRPERSSTYVKAKMRTDEGKDIWLNLSMSNA